MNDDTGFERYLSDRARTIDLPTTPASAIAGRAARRHRRQRAIALAAVASAGAVAGAAVLRSGGDSKHQVTAGSQPTAARLQWTVTEPASGLGYGASTASVNGNLYALSTAPGAANDTSAQPSAPTLYRSSDGKEWSTMALPNGLSASALSAAGDTLYAVGTAPAGGGRAAVVDSTSDGGATWSTVTLPIDVNALDALSGAPVVIGAPSIAKGSDGYVATVAVQGTPDINKLLPPGTPTNGGYAIDAKGVSLFAAPDCAPVDSSSSSDTATCELEAKSAAVSTPATTYTWDQLGVSPELQRLYRGEVHVFTSADGRSFTEQPLDVVGSGPQVIATNDGFRLVTTQYDTTTSTVEVRSSSDGTSWALDATLPGYTNGAGLVDGHLGVVLNDLSGAAALHIESASGWSTVDLLSGIANDGKGGPYVEAVGFGPLGVVAAIETPGDSNIGRQYIVRYDGHGTSVLAVDAVYPTISSQVSGISVTSDAVLVRISDATNDPNVVPTQHVLVGVPQ